MLFKISTIYLASILTFTSHLTYAESKIKFNADFGYAAYDAHNDISTGVGLGLAINKYFELELNYHDYGEIGDTGYEDFPGVSTTSYSLATNIKRQFSDSFKAFAILGYEEISVDGKASQPIAPGSPFQTIIYRDERRSGLMYGLGGAYSLSNNSDLTAKWLSHDSGDLNTLTIGFAYWF